MQYLNSVKYMKKFIILSNSNFDTKRQVSVSFNYNEENLKLDHISRNFSGTNIWPFV